MYYVKYVRTIFRTLGCLEDVRSQSVLYKESNPTVLKETTDQNLKLSSTKRSPMFKVIRTQNIAFGTDTVPYDKVFSV